ncbi:DUF2931 family protein [Winslowiella iniecta]|uniref:DUF2931 family protein n=1 Tax=Winslowiella iniecta TaxID=1560201 RepID=UPI0009E4DD43|nr:DUF2931 family protein [Winslowiella iniecta]
MVEDEKDAPGNIGYYRYEIIGDNSHRTNIHGTGKVVQCRRVPVRMTVCWDSVIDKKAYETEIWFSRETWQQMLAAYPDTYRPGKTYYRDNMIIGLAPGGTVRVWLENNGDPVVLQHPARQLTLTGDDMLICKGITKHPNGYVYYGKTPEFIKGKTYPYGEW